MTVSTKKTYKSAERRYFKFCTDFNINPFPTNEAILCYYVACLGQEGLVHATIKTYLAGVRQLQLASGFPDPGLTGLPRLQQVLKGVRVEQGKRGRAPRPRLPITPNILRRMRVVWLEGTLSADSLMLWSVASLTFFSFCRLGELTGGGYLRPRLSFMLWGSISQPESRPIHHCYLPQALQNQPLPQGGAYHGGTNWYGALPCGPT